MTNAILEKAIQAAEISEVAFTKYITANDVGATGGHQAGFHLHKGAWPLFFDTPGEKGSNKDHFATIKWQDDFETQSRFIYYGKGTRNEYRLTRFGKGFPFLQDENIGDLLVIARQAPEYYEAFVLRSDDDIESFLAAMSISTASVNGIIPKKNEVSPRDVLSACFEAYINAVTVDFPTTLEIANSARGCYFKAHRVTDEMVKSKPDRELLNWIDAEFQLFKAFEMSRYSERIQRPFSSVEELVGVANTILNRRKSRAGKSLEHHLGEVFTISELHFDTQATTEGKKRPDFLFPNAAAYHNASFSEDKLLVLAAKTTCKDRWRQILNEADRVKTKHLFTLQQGISENQLTEMLKYNVQLVVPKAHLKSFPATFRDKILTLSPFIAKVQTLQSRTLS